jgi:protein-tyrosine phosphatase
MVDDRHLDWEGGFNIRDLGGIGGADGHVTIRGAVVRSGSLHHLTAAGWSELQAFGIRTIVDLRNDDERAADGYTVPTAEITLAHLPIEEEKQESDIEFWKEWRPFFCTPLYYAAFLKHFPDRCATAIATIANAQAGGVLFHCGIGRDRTGLIAMLILKLAGVAHEDIAADFAMSTERLRPHWERLGRANDEEAIANLLARRNTTSADAMLSSVTTSVDIYAILREGGLTDDDLEALRKRLLGTADMGFRH